MRSIFTLYKFEIKQNLKSFIIWFAILTIVLFLMMSMFPTFKSSEYLELINAKIDAIPKGLGAAFGLNASVAGASFQNIVFWFGYMYQYFVIAIIMYAINLGSNIVSKENEDNHIDYLATKPIAKSHILVAKYKVLVTFILIFSICMFVVGCVSIMLFNSDNTPFVDNLARLHIKMFFEYLFFGTLAFALSAMSKKTSKSTLIVVGVFFATFLLGVVSQLQEGLHKLLYFSPYFVFQTDQAGYGFSSTDWRYLIGLGVVIAILFVLAIWRYTHKDISL